jgi:C4-dicarboxylate transporter, DctM subunit
MPRLVIPASNIPSLPNRHVPPSPRLFLLRCDEIIASFVDWTVIIGVVVLTVVLVAQVLSRYVVNVSLVWSEELARYLTVWLTFLGVGLGVRSGTHFGVTIFLERVPQPVRDYLGAVRDASMLFFFGFMIVQGCVSASFSAGEFSAALGIPMRYMYWVFPVAGTIGILHAVARSIRTKANWRYDLVAVVALAAASGILLRVVQMPAAAALPLFLITAVTLLLIGSPIAVAIGMGVIVAVGWTGISPLVIMTEQLFNATNNFTLMAVPFFMLTGTFLMTSGLADRLIDFCIVVVGRMRGGLAIVDVFASILFADISGSSTSDTAAIGSTMIPGLVKNGYRPAFAVALQAAAGSMGMLIPPSICTIVYATTAGVSVATMFLSSLLPAALMAGSFIAIAYWHARRNHLGGGPSLSSAQKIVAVRRSILPLLTPVIILFGILSGIFTPTEAGVVALVYTVLAGVATRGLNATKAREAVHSGVRNFSMVFLVIGTASMLSWVLTYLHIPHVVAAALAGFSDDKIVVLLVTMALMALMHTAVETVASILIVTPILLPVLIQMDISPVQFGVLLLMNSSLGLILPPLGMCLYISCAIGNVPLDKATRAIVPFAVAIALDLLVLIVYPQITLIVPKLFSLS